MKAALSFFVTLMGIHSSLSAASNPSQIVCRSESWLNSKTYYGYVQSIDKLDSRLVVKFEKYEAVPVSDPSDSKCGYHYSDCLDCKVFKYDFNKLTYRPANATATVLCAAGSSVEEYRSISSFVLGIHEFRAFTSRIVGGIPVRATRNFSSPSCVDWVD